ncbi:hypothetical protein L227DRAFT_610014 [Lentinus tigrinus ALCF2SS1-6]|uniref:Uncharacterized protein n=2 Tax=Lentinus tigrinus TaxID=5365 RepID=A0A5C2SG76_9APHY|nr:hypothetical protein L227DRAFT_610014 [Lentinus tigrinus ALCF2SS1-6]
MSTRYANRQVPVMHEGVHFTLVLKYDEKSRETKRTWVYKKEKVLEQDQHLRIPKAKSSGEQFPIVPSAPLPDSIDRFAPAYGADRKLLRETPAVGTRYCQHIHAYVPENLPYRVSGLAAAPKAPLTERLLSREFWQLPFAGENGAGSSMNMDIRVVPAKVHAEGLTHHQAKLVSLQEAQKDLGIKYRSLTQTRDDLVTVGRAQREGAIKYRTVAGEFLISGDCQ